MVSSDLLNNVIASLMRGKSNSVALSESQKINESLNNYGKGLMLLAYARDQAKNASILSLNFIEEDLEELPLWAMTAAMSRLSKEIEDSKNSDDADLIYQNYSMSELLEKIFCAFMKKKQSYLLSENRGISEENLHDTFPKSIFFFDDESYIEEKNIVDVLFQREFQKMTSLHRLMFLLLLAVTAPTLAASRREGARLSVS